MQDQHHGNPTLTDMLRTSMAEAKPREAREGPTIHVSGGTNLFLWGGTVIIRDARDEATDEGA